VREGLWAKFESMFRNFGWDVVVLRHGKAQQAAFAEPGGERLREWIEACPNQLYSALTFGGGAAWRARLRDELGDQGEVTALLDRRTDAELAALMGNLGGHDMPSLLEAFEAAKAHDRPVCFICYTIKGFGLPLAGHKDNHAGLMNLQQVETLRQAMGVRPGHEWDRFEGLATPPERLQAFLSAVPFNSQGMRRLQAPTIPVPDFSAAASPSRLPTCSVWLRNVSGLLPASIGSRCCSTSAATRYGISADSRATEHAREGCSWSSSGVDRQCDGQPPPVWPQPPPAHASRGSFTLTSPNSVAIRCGRQPFTWHLPLHD